MVFKISSNQPLDKLNTFAVCANADTFCTFHSVSEVLENINTIQSFRRRLVLGGGSNILFVRDYDGLIIYPQIFGVEVTSQADDSVLVVASASENWHEFVMDMTNRGYFGLENLALIPGTVGASPVQNIGAYGVEVKSLIEWVECIDIDKGELLKLSREECQFGYRDSLFKRAGQGKYLVTRVAFALSLTPKVNLSYAPLANAFSNSKKNASVSPMAVLETVCQIRQSKLPDPKVMANAGSFFKNPVVSAKQFEQLKQAYSELVAYPADDKVKIAAGWLIDNAGLKGFSRGLVEVHREQALVLVNRGEKQGSKVLELARIVQEKVEQMYGITLEPEVRIEPGEYPENGQDSHGPAG
ncbi:UDP-N-acetylmuramate dehydrogenase [Aliikangiella sp. G2MR2-5]|uniref:UDP-N-acetylmuramate dehydrogenase n=1 Tax=Aliikangiella sp. G2MR2-5 TaxID=2788943 RepID=UPI0018A90ECE|nr:UDP-N-acetylmuramate dehydrogenase [Aliikangiella sp. G2MR2-5]